MMKVDRNRCSWCASDVLYQNYHDTEWGVPVYDDAILFEFLLLETYQAGLSWITILRKRNNFRMAFDNFDYHLIARYNQSKIDELLENRGIIRNKLKAYSAVSNAQQFIKVQEEFGSFSDYLWAFVKHQPLINQPQTLKDVLPTTALSDKISKDLKKRGFKFLGSTTVYAFMQAVGLVNDHVADCWLAKKSV